MPEFAYTDLLPLGPDATDYRLLTADGITKRHAFGRDFLEVDPEVLTLVAREGMRDIAHLLRPGHLRQLRAILDDPEASRNDRFVAMDLLKNAGIAAGGVLPMCQDTGTAIVMGKRGGQVLTDGRDEEHLSRGIYEAYTQLNLRYSQLAPLSMFEERNTGTNLPAQVEVYATAGQEYKFLLMAKGGGSANKSFLYQQTKAVLNPAGLHAFLEEKIRSLGTAACPPYHLAIVVGGTSAEYALKTAKYASARYLDTLPAGGSPAGNGFRDPELEQEVLEITRKIGIGAQFGGKYFCHDVRVIRLPRHGASCPVAIAVSCSADRQALAKITPEGVYLERLETDPAQYLPDTSEDDLADDVVRIDLNRPMSEIRAELTKYPVATRLSLTGPLVVARDIAHAKIAERLAAGEPMPRYLADHPVYYAGPGQDPRGVRLGLVRPDDRRPDGFVREPVPGRGRVPGHAGQGEPLTGRHRGLPRARRVLPGFHRRRGGQAGPGLHRPRSRSSSTRNSAWRRSGASRSAISPRSSSWTTRATTSSPRSRSRRCSPSAPGNRRRPAGRLRVHTACDQGMSAR